MPRKVAKATMRICSARTSDRSTSNLDSVARQASGFTLVELIVVVSIMGLLVLVAQLNLFGSLQRSSFKAQAQSFISALEMAASGAAETGRRYEMIVDVSQQTYLLREITSADLSEVLDEEVIVTGQFGTSCRVSYVEFDDGDYTNDGQAKFRVGHGGWMYAGKIVLLDDNDLPHSVVVSRLTPVVQLVKGDPELMHPKREREVPTF